MTPEAPDLPGGEPLTGDETATGTSPLREFPVELLRRGVLATGEQEVVFAVEVPAELHYFVGHFPGMPILPGVAQIFPLVVEQVHAAWDDLEHPRGLRRLKFRQRIAPGTRLHLSLRRRGGEVRFRLEAAGRACSEGILDYGPWGT